MGKLATRYNTDLESAKKRLEYFKSQPSGYINGLCRESISNLIDEIEEYNKTKELDNYVINKYGSFENLIEWGKNNEIEVTNYQTTSLEKAEEQLNHYINLHETSGRDWSNSINKMKAVIKQIKEKYNLINKWNKKGRLNKFDSDITKYYVAIMLENIYCGEAN